SVELFQRLAQLARLFEAQHAADVGGNLADVGLEYPVLDLEDLRRVHREDAQAHAEEQAGQLGVAGHFAAHRDRDTDLLGALHGVGEQHQHRRVQRVVERGHLFVGTVDGQRVLDQVVGADRQEIETAQKKADGQRGGRNFDHAATSMFSSKATLSPRRLDLACSSAASVWSISWAWASIGIKSLIGPYFEARRMARNCVWNICGSASDRRMARRPRAGLVLTRSPKLESGRRSLSLPRSKV